MQSTTLPTGDHTFPVGTDAEFAARVNATPDADLERFFGVRLRDPDTIARVRALFRTDPDLTAVTS